MLLYYYVGQRFHGAPAEGGLIHRAKLTCRDCGEEFIEVPGKRGYRNQCPECSEKQAEPELLGGNMIWDHKTAPYIELKTLSKAQSFAEMQSRHKGR